jgi:hypothetical protein
MYEVPYLLVFSCVIAIQLTLAVPYSLNNCREVLNCVTVLFIIFIYTADRGGLAV